MAQLEKDQVLAQCLEDYHRRRALGEHPGAADYRGRAGTFFDEFLQILAAESAIDEILAPPPEEALPRPFGPYTLLRELGRGAVGVVYEALHRDLGRRVALKVLRTGFDTEPSALERFRREARACAQVRHDHIVEIYEYGESQGRPYYSMTLIDGESLAHAVRHGRVPDPRTLFRGLAGIADGLEALHARGIVHRDVKPSNIMIVHPGGRMVLADFGLARTASTLSLTRTGDALGTPLYMSPEQMLGKREDIDGRTDVYQLGATAYEALSGRPPFKTDDLHTLMRMVLAQRPEPLSAVAPSVPLAAEHVVMKALEKRREDRYPSAAALRDDMLAFVEGRDVAGRPVSAFRLRLRRLRPWALPVAAAAALAVGYAAWVELRPDDPAYLSCTSVPPAEVAVDGASRGKTPLVELPLKPGPHRVALRVPGFEEQVEQKSLSPGEKWTLTSVLVVQEPENAEALAWLGRSLNVPMKDLSAPALQRGTPSDSLTLLYPRGDVRLADLETFGFEAGGSFVSGGGTLEFRRGDEVLYHREFVEPEFEENYDLPVPAGVVSALKVGDRVEWGWYPKDGKGAVTASFHLVDDAEVAAILRNIESRLAGQPKVRDLLKAHLLLDKGLPLAAWAEARQVAGPESKTEQSPRALALMRVALARLDLTPSRLGVAVDRRWQKVPADVQARLLAPPR
jgi:hypothetical protein